MPLQEPWCIFALRGTHTLAQRSFPVGDSNDWSSCCIIFLYFSLYRDGSSPLAPAAATAIFETTAVVVVMPPASLRAESLALLTHSNLVYFVTCLHNNLSSSSDCNFCECMIARSHILKTHDSQAHCLRESRTIRPSHWIASCVEYNSRLVFTKELHESRQNFDV